jgi:hypothetical protein
MTNNLLDTMSNDMKIIRYRNESDYSYTCRLCYSALGQWCLNLSRNINANQYGTSKINQTNILKKILSSFYKLFPNITKFFIDSSDKSNEIYVLIRRIYEETGYLITNKNNYNILANFGRGISFGSESLFFGIPNESYSVNGLGIFTQSSNYEVKIKDFLIRDNLTSDEYFYANFNPIYFYDIGINIDQLEFFNSLLRKSPSKSWGKRLTTEFTLARASKIGPYYKIMQLNSGIKFVDQPIETQHDSFTSNEYRRLYFAIKKYYNNPLKVFISQLDDNYSKISLGGHLPNREYYFLLLLSWPEDNAFNKIDFIIRNYLLDHLFEIFENIGLEVKKR